MDFFKKAQGLAEKYGSEHKQSSGGSHEAATTTKTPDVSSLLNSASSLFSHGGDKAPSTGPPAGEADEGSMSDLIHSAQSLLLSNSKTKPATSAPKKDAPVSAPTNTDAVPVATHNNTQGPKPSYSELYDSAQTLYQGIADKKSGKEPDTAKVASAAENLLRGAGSYGNLSEGKYGEYLTKAEGYIHSYASKHQVAPPTSPAPPTAPPTSPAPPTVPTSHS